MSFNTGISTTTCASSASRRPVPTSIDATHLVPPCVVAVFVGSIAGVLPALRQTGVDLVSAIQVGGNRSMGSAGRRLRETLVVVEVVLAIVLLVGGALFASSFVKLLIGVRAALGATPGELVVMVFRQGMTVTVIGLTIGLAASVVASRAMASVLFEVEALHGAALVIPSAVVLLVAAASCYLPGRRAAAVDPAEALVWE